MQLVFATGNQNKVGEVLPLLPKGIEILSLKDINCTQEIPETSDTIEGNSMQKANYVFANYQLNCFAEDTGLIVDALNGEPGIYSARYAGPQCSAEDNMNLLLQKMTGVTDRTARFKTVFTLIVDGKPKQFEGITEGVITTERHGAQGFGYDPIFMPGGIDKTYAQMTMDEKSVISHRGKALRSMLACLQQIAF